MPNRCVLLAILWLGLGSSAFAQTVTLPQIMADPDWIGRPPQRAYWADDGKSVFFWQKREGSQLQDLYEVGLKGQGPTLVAGAERGRVSWRGGDWSEDRRTKVFEREGDLFLANARNGEIRQLTRTEERESGPTFLRGDDAFWFRRGEQIFVRSLEDGLEFQPAHLLAEDDPDEDDEGEPTYLERQQEDLFGIVRLWRQNEEERDEQRRELREADPTRSGRPWYLGEKKEIEGSDLSPTGRWMFVALTPAKPDEGQRDEMPNYVSESGYVSSRKVRPKVGTGKESGEQLLLLDLQTHEKHVLDLSALPDIEVDRLAPIRERSKEWLRERSGDEPDEETVDDEEASSEEDGAKEKKEPRPVTVFGREWNEAGDQLLLQLFSTDNKDRWIVRVDCATREVAVEHHLYDEAWINYRYNELGWVPKQDAIYYLSEESGRSQLYVKEPGESARRLTDGRGTIADVTPDPRGRHLYFRGNLEHPGLYEIYRVSAGGGKVEQITRLGGMNQAELSPDGKRLLIRHSEIDRHEELYVQDAKPGAKAVQLTHTVSDAFASQEWVVPEIVTIEGQGTIYAKYYPPADGSPTGGPAVVFVHGAGYLQNAHYGWSYYFREFMFHTLLSQHGYAVLDLDYRASAGYGRDWRTAIYRQMGTPELDDLTDGIEWLAREHGIDRNRIGVYGGSYGGFLTLMALFTRQDMFACGAALRPVTDWAHYNQWYTANILNEPRDDHESFYRSSPIEHAEGLQKPLLMCHGMQDDNVLFQDTVRLAQRLIELEKEDWEVAMYPIEPHGFRQPSSWLDEYRRIFKLMETHLK